MIGVYADGVSRPSAHALMLAVSAGLAAGSARPAVLCLCAGVGQVAVSAAVFALSLSGSDIER